MIGLAGPAFAASAIGVVIWIAAARGLPKDEGDAHGAAISYPSIGGQGTGATVTAATAAETHENIRYFDPRIRPWIVTGLIIGHAQAMTGQAIGFLIIDRMHLPPAEALHPTGLVLMMGAGASLLAQWGLIPMLDLRPRALVLTGAALGAIGCRSQRARRRRSTASRSAMRSRRSAWVSRGRASPPAPRWAWVRKRRGSVAGKVTSVNGAAFVLGPSIKESGCTSCGGRCPISLRRDGWHACWSMRGWRRGGRRPELPLPGREGIEGGCGPGDIATTSAAHPFRVYPPTPSPSPAGEGDRDQSAPFGPCPRSMPGAMKPMGWIAEACCFSRPDIA